MMRVFQKENRLLSPRAQTVLEKLGHTQLRDAQVEIVDAGLKRKDIFAVLPTGGGKSLCFQLPAFAQNGMTIIVSPLLALMRDQIAGLGASGLKAAMISSDQTEKEFDRTISMILKGQLKLLYLSPEQLAKSSISYILDKANINRLVLDEAHCASSWGHDFRPDYRKISDWIAARPSIQVSAYTATATPAVIDDLKLLLFSGRKPKTFFSSPIRSNININFAPKSSPREQLLENIPAAGSVIIYAATRSKTQVLAQAIGAEADFYHAGLEPDERKLKERAFLNGNTRIMVATNAFGMGVDKPDIRAVIHADIPPSIEAFIQEIGRAGRDGEASRTVCLFDETDIEFRAGHIRSGTSTEVRRRHELSMLSKMLTLAIDENNWPEIERYFGFDGDAFLGESQFEQNEIAQAICENALIGDEGDIDPDLLRWRNALAKAKKYAPFMVLPDVILARITNANPANIDELAAIEGIGASRLEKYGAQLLDVLTGNGRALSAKRRKIALSGDGDIFEALNDIAKELRYGVAGTDRPIEISPTILDRVIKAHPRSLHDFTRIKGMDEKRIARFGDAFLLELNSEDG